MSQVAIGCTQLPPGFSLIQNETIAPYRPLARDLMETFTRTIVVEGTADPKEECAMLGNFVHTDTAWEYTDDQPGQRINEVDPFQEALLNERVIACTLLPTGFKTVFHPGDRKLFIHPSMPDVEELEDQPTAAMVVENVDGKGIPYFSCATYGVPTGRYVRPSKMDKYIPEEEARRDVDVNFSHEGVLRDSGSSADWSYPDDVLDADLLEVTTGVIPDADTHLCDLL